MAISSNVRQLESDKFVESTSTANQAAIAIVNPDGTTVAASTVHGSLVSASKTVATAGTPEVLVASTTACERVNVQAYIGNTGNVAVGDSAVDASTTGTGLLLEPGDSASFFINDVNKLYLDVLTNGDGIRFNYYA